MTTIRTTGTDIHVQDRAEGGYVIRQGYSRIMLNIPEAAELATILRGLSNDRLSATTPAKARLMRYVNGEAV